MIGYLGLTALAVLAANRRYSRQLTVLLALIILAHVFLVWAIRYDWQFTRATRHGYAGFLLFHGALLCLAGATALPPAWARALLMVAYFIVSAGAIGATFRYEVVAVYRIPVLFLASIGTAMIWRQFFQQLRQRL